MLYVKPVYMILHNNVRSVNGKLLITIKVSKYLGKKEKMEVIQYTLYVQINT